MLALTTAENKKKQESNRNPLELINLNFILLKILLSN